VVAGVKPGAVGMTAWKRVASLGRRLRRVHDQACA
jgi:hypothetical protein